MSIIKFPARRDVRAVEAVDAHAHVMRRDLPLASERHSAPKRDFTVAIAPYDGGNLAIVDGGEAIDVVGDWGPGDKLLVADMDGRARIVQVAKKGRDWLLTTRGAAHRVQAGAPPQPRVDSQDRSRSAGPPSYSTARDRTPPASRSAPGSGR